MNIRNPLWQNIPTELKELNQWIYWRLEEVNGRMTKIPYNAKSGHKASTTNPATWSSFDDAVRTSVNGNGIGFVFAEGGGFVGVDIDNSCEPQLVEWFNTYAERSQSKKGVHIIMRGNLPLRFNEGSGRRCGNFEVYSSGRYFVFTGDKINNEPIRDCQAKLDEFILEVFPAPEPITQTKVDVTGLCGKATPEHSVIERIRNSAQADKFNSLWSGSWQSMYASQSEADAALLSILRFWTGGDMKDSFDLFRQSGLMRKKTERADYLPRVWDAINSGDVYTAPEPLPEQFIQTYNQQTPPWRKITIDHVAQALKGTILWPMCEALCTPTDPPLPLEVGLAKALPLCGCALSGKRHADDGLSTFIQKGGDLSRVRIMSGGGQTPNFWTLLVGESASGKDIGGISDKAAMQFKWLIGSAGSEEGIADSYIHNQVGLLSISEMMNWLDSRHWQGKAAGFLTHAFNKGWFSHAMAKKNDSAPRESDYCFPNICASIQPGVIQEKATQMHLETGFLGRFIIIQMPSFIAYPVSRSLDSEIHTVVDILKVLDSKKGEVIPPARYNEKLNTLFSNNRASPNPTWKRLSAEYYPRLAILLSCPVGDTSTTVTVTEDGWRRAEIIVQYLFSQAETVLSTLHYDPVQSRFENLCERILKLIQSKQGGECLLSVISHEAGRSTKAKDREEAIKELESRGYIQRTQGKASNGKPVTMLRAVLSA